MNRDFDNLDAAELQALDARDRQRLALAQNVATNGRLFCVMVFLACLTLFVVTKSQVFVALAMLAAGSVGVSVLVDPLPAGRFRTFLTSLAYGLAVMSFLLLMTKLG